MNAVHLNNSAFIARLTKIVEAHLADENFDTTEFAEKVGLSRSQIHRRLKKITNKSVSQFIREIRLAKAKEFLEQGNLTVSEIAYKVGFGSPSYFIKSFHDLYGYSPGKIGSGEVSINKLGHDEQSIEKSRRTILISAVSLLVLATFFSLIFKPFPFQKNKSKITIVVLPVEYGKQDSSRLDILNQIIREVINNLCLVKEISVIKPWTSVRKYINSDKTALEIAGEQHVQYVVESYVTTIFNNQVYLTVNLTEGHPETLQSTDTVNLDYTNAAITVQKITKVLLRQLNVKPTPEVYKRINKIDTDNPKALKLYWAGMDLFNQWLWDKESSNEKLKQAKNLIEMAIKDDGDFAVAYAQLAIIYYKMMNNGLSDDTFDDKIDRNSDKAFKLDSLNDLCLVAKAYDYINKGEDEKAILYLERALDYNPNLLIALRELNNIYQGCTSCHLRDNEKQLEYALRVIRSESIANSRDSITKYDYYYLGLAFRQSGFFEEAEKYFNKALENDSNYVDALVQRARIESDFNRYKFSSKVLKDCIQKDSTNNFAKNQLWLAYYLNRDYDSAYFYLTRAEIIETGSMGYYAGRISLLCSMKGEYEEAKVWKQRYFDYADSIQSTLKRYHLIASYTLNGDLQNAIRQMKILSKEGNYPCWVLSVLETDLIFDDIREHVKFRRVFLKMERNFWKEHDRIKASLTKKGLL